MRCLRATIPHFPSPWPLMRAWAKWGETEYSLRTNMVHVSDYVRFSQTFHWLTTGLWIWGFRPSAKSVGNVRPTAPVRRLGTGKERRFVAIDYVNDQPELCVRSEKVGGGPVAEVVEHAAERIVDVAWRMSRGIEPGIYRSIWLAKAHLADEGI